MKEPFALPAARTGLPGVILLACSVVLVVPELRTGPGRAAGETPPEAERPPATRPGRGDDARERVRRLRARGRIERALERARALQARRDDPELARRVKELRELARRVSRLEFAVDRLAEDGERSRHALRHLHRAGRAGRLALRRAVLDGDPTVASAAAVALADLGDAGAIPVVMTRLARAKHPAMINALAGVLERLLPDFSEKRIRRLWRRFSEWRQARRRAAATVLVAYARRALGADPDRFDDVAGAPGAYARLRAFLERARGSERDATAAWAGRMLRQLRLRWTGAGDTARASEPANWAHGVVPSRSTIVVLDHESAGDLIWNGAHPEVPESVAGWRQGPGYTGTVTIETTYPREHNDAFDSLRVRGDASLRGGEWSHPKNPRGYGAGDADVYRLHVAVNGDLTVGPEAAIDVTSRGYAARAEGHGGASHGGRGAEGPAPYGSLKRPTRLGMGARSTAAGNTAGGGAIRLTVTGTARIDGALRAGVRFRPEGEGILAGAGGSILIACGRLTGAGTIAATGGRTRGANGAGPGGGGRIAVRLRAPEATLKPFDGTFTARGGGGGNDGKRWPAAGSIFLRPGERAATDPRLVIDFASRPGVPPDGKVHPHELTDEPLAETRVVLRHEARLAVARSRRFRALRLAGEQNELIVAEGAELRVGALEIAGESHGPAGSPYTAESLGRAVSGAGRIRVTGRGSR